MTAIAHFDDHDVVALARWLEADLAAATERPLWTMSTKDTEDALLSLTRARGQLDALLMRVLRQAQAAGAGMDTGATTTVTGGRTRRAPPVPRRTGWRGWRRRWRTTTRLPTGWRRAICARTRRG